MAKSKIAFDTNIWISFTIGKRLSHLRNILKSGEYEVIYCAELVHEYYDVVTRKKLARYVTEQRILDTIELMESFATPVNIISTVVNTNDAKDSYLLALCADAKLDLLITGDKGLLSIKNSGSTRIITFSQFVKIATALDSGC